MQKYDVSNFLLSEFLSHVSDEEKPIANRILIDEMVNGWNNSIYFMPKNKLKINHYLPQNYRLM